MNLKTKIALFFLVGFIAIQFFQPARNNAERVLPTDIQKIYPVPKQVMNVLRTSCYDCHSNKTNYPWYTSIQPVGWILASHIKSGKSNLNFSEFGAYSNRKQQSKLRAIINSVNDDTMPLDSYLEIHVNAKLSAQSKAVLIDWFKTTKDSLSLNN